MFLAGSCSRVASAVDRSRRNPLLDPVVQSDSCIMQLAALHSDRPCGLCLRFCVEKRGPDLKSTASTQRRCIHAPRSIALLLASWDLMVQHLTSPRSPRLAFFLVRTAAVQLPSARTLNGFGLGASNRVAVFPDGREGDRRPGAAQEPVGIDGRFHAVAAERNY